MINQNCLGFASTGALVSTAGPISTVGVIVAAACAVLAVALVGYFVTKAKGTRRGYVHVRRVTVSPVRQDASRGFKQ